MAERIAKGTWVEIHNVVLTADERAPQVPDDTRRVPLEMRVKGFLVAAANLNDEVDIITPAGRQLRGALIEVNPAYSHQFGTPIPELVPVGGEVRTILRKQGFVK